MWSYKLLGFYQFINLILFLPLDLCVEEVCDRRPLGTKTAPLPPDNRFAIDVNVLGDLYIPRHEYKVRLYSVDGISTFIGFTISVGEDTAINELNPRRPKHLDPGQLFPIPTSDDTKVHPNCRNTLIEADIQPKTSVEVVWIAPSKDNKCVTIYAVVAVKPDVWYSFEGPLSRRICENRQKDEDMQPLENEHCQECEEARYQMLFEGLWSYNTHPQMFPQSRELARFSDVVGASHSQYFVLYKFNSEATDGLKMLAEQGNTTQLEMEILKELGHSVRTVIKATGPPSTDATTVTSFRVTPEHHLVSIAAALLPSPDWFLGVSNLELCSVITKKWAENVVLNLYPMDAGTDSGLSFESSNDETSPPQPISSAKITKDVPKESSKPFARLKFNLIRTYSTPRCTASTKPSRDEEGDNGDTDTGETEPIHKEPTTQESEEPVTPAPPGPPEKCPMTPWEDWLPCEGKCVDGTRTGLQIRFRYHIVDGVVVGKHGDTVSSRRKEIPEYCMREATSDFQYCEEDCSDETTETPMEDETDAEALSRRWRRAKKNG